MSAEPKISVITVVRNGAGMLEETVRSVLALKSTRTLDYLIIDGGSTDGTLQIIERYADQLRYWVSEPDRGTYDAMNKGWEAADPDSLILFIGAGDRVVSLPDKLAQYGAQDVIYGPVRMGESRVFQPRADWHLKIYNTLHHQALLVPKSIHPKPPFDCGYPLYADFNFNQQLMKAGARFLYDPGLIGYARPGGASDTPDFEESLRVIRSNFGFLWAALAVSGYYALKSLPFLRIIRPVKKLG